MITLPPLVKNVLCMYSSIHNTSAMCFWHCNANGTPHPPPNLMLSTAFVKMPKEHKSQVNPPIVLICFFLIQYSPSLFPTPNCILHPIPKTPVEIKPYKIPDHLSTLPLRPNQGSQGLNSIDWSNAVILNVSTTPSTTHPRCNPIRNPVSILTTVVQWDGW